MIKNEHGQHVCTANEPWSEEIDDGSRVVHPDAIVKEDLDWHGSDHYDRFTCPHCALRFKVTLPSH